MTCTCTHQPHRHSLVTYPQYRRPCRVCLNCGGSTLTVCCISPIPCLCTNLREETVNDQLRDAAARAAVWGVIAAAAKDRQDEAKAELAAMEPGDTIAGKVNGQVVGKATKVNGRQKIAVSDEQALLAWVKEHHPTEIVEAVNPAFLKTFGTVDGQVHWQGEPVDFMRVEQGAPYVSVKRTPEAETIVAGLLAHGRVQLQGLRAITPRLDEAI